MGDSYHSFSQIVSYAIAHNLPLIGAGDLIDRRINEPEPIVYLKKECDRLEHAGLKLYYTQGQHEIDDTPWFELGKSTVHLHKCLVKIGKLRIYGLDYQHADKLKEELNAIPQDTDVLVCHQVWGDFMGSICLPQGDFADIPTVKTVVTGDFHETRLEQARGKDGQKMRIFSPGSGCMQEIAEPPKKYFGVLWSDGRIEKEELFTRYFIDWPVINSEDDLERFLGTFNLHLEAAESYAVLHSFPHNMATPLLRITISYKIVDANRRIRKLVEERAHLFWKELPPEKVEPRLLEEVPDLRSGEALTLATMLPNVIDPKEEPEAFALCQRLLNADEPKLALASWIHEVMQDESESS